MNVRSVQAAQSVVMIRPHHFSVNQQSAADNNFQRRPFEIDASRLSEKAYDELTTAAQTLEGEGIRVHVFEDRSTETPDSVFPNNWFSTHPGGHVAVYPMHVVNRRAEYRRDVIDMLKRDYRVRDVIDYSGMEPDGLFLEGTGSMVLDHIDRVAYAVISNRTNPIALERFCSHFNYEPMVFEAEDESGQPVYHTNVLMSIATSFVLIGLDMIKGAVRRAEIVKRFESSGRTVIPLSNEQINCFAGNAIELEGAHTRSLALSSRALAALTEEQKTLISQTVSLLALHIPTIELSGGSVRCMLAGIHLSPR